MENRDLQEKPKWDGETVSYRQQHKKLKRQQNGVVEHVLDEFEAKGWSEWVGIPAKIDPHADLEQAISYFNKDAPVHLRH